MGFMEKMEETVRQNRHNAKFEGVAIIGNKLHDKSRKWPVRKCHATVDQGANIAARMTATRVVGGAVLLGPLGAVLGGLAKKNRSKVYLAIEVPDDLILVELKAKKEGDAKQFAAKVNAAAADFQKEFEREKPRAAELEAAEAEGREPKPATPASPPPPPPGDLPAGWYPRGDVQQYWDGSQWTEHTAPLPPTHS